MKKLFAITGICALLAAPAFAQTDNNQEGAEPAEAAVEAPTTEEVDAAVATLASIAEDQQKIEGYCAISKEMEGIAENDEAKAEELGKKMDDYLTSLGEDVVEAFATAEAADPESEDGKKIDAAFGTLEEKCAA